MVAAAVVVVEEIACGRRPPENWKTRIARPTAMSDSLVMRLFSLSPPTIAILPLTFFSFFSLTPSALVFFLPPPPQPLEVLFPYIYTYIHRETAVRRFPAAMAERNNKRVSDADEEIRYDNSGEYKKNDETENRSERVASLDRCRIIYDTCVYRWKILRNILHIRRAVHFKSMTAHYGTRMP